MIHYRVAEAGAGAQVTSVGVRSSEDGASRAKRLAEGLRGLLKEELKEYGGTEGFVRWVRSDEDAA